MPRKPRLHSPGGLYHDILRGKNRQDNLNDDVDRLELGSFVATGMEARSIKSTPAPFTAPFNEQHGATGGWHVSWRWQRKQDLRGQVYHLAYSLR